MVVTKVYWQLFKIYSVWRIKMYLSLPVDLLGV